MRHEFLTQRALFVSESVQKGHAESALCDELLTQCAFFCIGVSAK